MLLPIFVFANIGKITVAKGDVKIKRNGKIIKAKSGTVLKKHDFVKTDKNGKVQIVFKDNTVFTIGKNSTLDIADYLYDEKKPKKNRAKFNVLKGAFSSITGRIGKLNKSKFKLRTKSASIGIRGTIVKANQKTVMCMQGAITVTTPNGVTVRVEAGQKTDVSKGTPTAPTTITKADEKALGVDTENEKTDDTKTKKDEKTKEKKKVVKITKKAKEVPATVESIKPVVADDVAADVAADVVSDETKSLRTVKLTGRSIQTDSTTGTGDQQTLNIEASGVSGNIDLESKGLIVTDDGGNKMPTTTTDTISWGYWSNDPSKKWVAGSATDVKVLDDLRNSTNTNDAKLQYTGKVMGSTTQGGDILIDQNNKVNINLDLKANSMAGSINFKTTGEQIWSSTMEGTIEDASNNFQSTSIDTSVLKPDEQENYIETKVETTGGTVNGQIYGDKAQAVGGTFDLSTGTATGDRATGVFKATK
jgi:hypothetical protein